MKKRLDILMLDKKLVTSRNDAQKLIEGGRVKVNGILIIKNNFQADEGDNIEADDANIFVARSGAKLQEAINQFDIKIKDFVCLDVGASTGGFTECLLNNGAKKVYSVDVGSDQLDEKLKEDERVINLEKTDIRNLEGLEELVDLIVVDVSFISILKIIPFLKKFLKKEGRIVLLIKPQYEIKDNKNKKGKVKNDGLVEEVIDGIKEAIKKEGYNVLGVIESPISGKRGGNKEYLIYCELLA